MRPKRKIVHSIAAGVLAAFLGLFTSPAFASGVSLEEPTGEFSVMSAYVTVNLACRSGGAYSFNATIVDAASNMTYPVHYQWQSGGGRSVGGSFDWISMGNVYTNTYGIGSTNTIYGGESSGREWIEVEVRINGVYGSARDTC